MSTDELTTEQEYVDHAYRSLVDMRARTQRVFDRIMDTSGFQELDHEIALRRRIAALGDSPRPLLFGRIDEDDGDRWYIGRRHVESEAGDEVVIEWRTPVAEPFYRAGAGDPMGLVRRRQHGREPSARLVCRRRVRRRRGRAGRAEASRSPARSSTSRSCTRARCRRR
jgi:DNA helicase IV